MKNNKSTLVTEKLGVPENILEIAQKTYDYIIEELSGSSIVIDDKITFVIPINDIVADMKLSTIELNIITDNTI
jgi:hypothetical protein